MKKLILLLLFAVFLSGNGSGKTVDPDLARTAAANYLASMPAKFPRGLTGGLNLCYTAVADNSSSLKIASLPLFYIFNIIGSQGFIIMSADDIITPVLAWSNESSFTADDIPVNFAAWLKGYEDQISHAIRSNAEPVPEVKSAWEHLSKGPLAMKPLKSNSGVGPLITTLWSQRPFYNDLCPYDITWNDRAVSGCVATAMAMVMKYHNYPPNGIGHHSYNSARYGTLSANFGATTYNWADMPNSLDSANTAVATLMYHCGVGVDMDYNVGSQGGSDAWVIAAERAACAENAMKHYFGYSGTMQGLKKSDYTDAQWINLLKTELDSKRPMVYAGFGQSGGHCFVCDGYNDSTYFHFNWGWAGNCNGYFLLNNLNPHLDWDFTSGQQAIIGIHPPDSTGGVNRFYNIALNAAITGISDTIHFEDALVIHTDIINNGAFTFNGDISACIFDTNGYFIQEVETIRGVTLTPGNHLPNGITFTNPGIPAMLPNIYFVEIMYSQGDTNQIIHDTNDFHNNKKLVVLNSGSVEMYSAMNVCPGLRMQQDDSVSVTLDIVNNGAGDMNGTLDLSIYDLNGDCQNFINEIRNFTLPANSHTNGLNFSTSSINVRPGSYLIALWFLPAGSADWQLIGSTNYANPVRIQVNALPLLADQYEPNNTVFTSSSLPVSFATNPAVIQTQGANCHTGTDVDYYSLSLPPGFTYVITGNLIDAYNDTAQVYTLDALWSYSTDGTTWSETYDDTITGNIIINNGGTIFFYLEPYYPGQTGTYQLNIRISRNPLGMDDPMQTDYLRVYPNPVIDHFILETSREEDVISGVELFSTSGCKLVTKYFDHPQPVCRMPAENLQDGVYILVVTTKFGIINRKIIIRRN